MHLGYGIYSMASCPGFHDGKLSPRIVFGNENMRRFALVETKLLARWLSAATTVAVHSRPMCMSSVAGHEAEERVMESREVFWTRL